MKQNNSTELLGHSFIEINGVNGPNPPDPNPDFSAWIFNSEYVLRVLVNDTTTTKIATIWGQLGPGPRHDRRENHHVSFLFPRPAKI